MSLFQTLTGVAKEPFIRKIVDTVDRYFFKDCSANETPFYEAYGIHGLGFSQLDDDFPGKPLVVIHNRDFLRLLVVNELSEVAISSDEMDSRITEMSQRRMRAEGSSQQKMDALEQIYKETS